MCVDGHDMSSNPLCAYLVRKLTGLIDVSVSFLLQLEDYFALFLRLISVGQYLLVQSFLCLLVQLHQIQLLLSGVSRLDHILNKHKQPQARRLYKGLDTTL